MTDFYFTYYDPEFIKNEPTRYLTDVFSACYNFNFIKETVIFPEFQYLLKGELIKKQIASQKTKINGFNRIEFGPFYYMNQPDTDIISDVLIKVKTQCGKTIFRKKYKVPDYRDYSFQPKYLDRTLSYKFIISSCYSLPGYRNPDIATYFKFAEVAREANPEFIICSGDIVYQEPLNITSRLASQGAYDQLKVFEPIKNVWSNHTWICSNDDHEFGYNDTMKNAPNIEVLRNIMLDNFPIAQVYDDIRCSSFTIKNITYILLDDVSEKIYNPEYTGIGNIIFSTILGPKQVEFLLNALSNVEDNFGTEALCFISVGKSMFASINDTFVFCPQERDIIFSHIKFLGLRNVCFMCGESHQSDVSEFVVNQGTNQIIREIRNSAIGSKPRNDPNDNPYQVRGSFVGGVNNFGLVSVSGKEKDYNIVYDVYTKDGIVYTYSWNTRY